MGIIFNHPIHILEDNENPHEDTFFSYLHDAIPDEGTCIDGYTIQGDIPLNVSIDNNGLISGDILYFGLQPSCILMNKVHLVMDRDGTNWNENGRFKEEYYDFNFTVTCNWKEQNSDGTPCSIGGSTSKEVTIRLVKDHNIDNLIWLKEYPNTKDIKVKINNTKEI